MTTVLLHLFDILGNELRTLAVSEASLLAATHRAVAFGYAQRNAEAGPRVHAFTVTTAEPLAQLRTTLWACYDVRDRRVTFQDVTGRGDAAKWFIADRPGERARSVLEVVHGIVRAHEQEQAEVRGLVAESLSMFLNGEGR